MIIVRDFWPYWPEELNVRVIALSYEETKTEEWTLHVHPLRPYERPRKKLLVVKGKAMP